MDKQHIVVVTQGTLGDLFPFMLLGRELQRRGHEVTIATHGGYAERLHAWGLNAIALDRPEDFAANAFGHPSDGGAGTGESPLDMLGGTMLQIVPQASILIDALSGSRVVLISHMNMLQVTLLVAERLQCPLVGVFPAPYFVDMLRTYVEMAPMFQFFNPLRAQLGLPDISSWLPQLQSIRLSVGLWPEWFAAPETRWLVACRPLGFVLPDESMFPPLMPDVAELVAQQPIVITHSSSLPTSDNFFRQAIQACAEYDEPLLVVTPHQELVGSLTTEKVHWFAESPFASVLPHARLVIHHGGIGTCAQALASATPQLILAHGWDRPSNGARLQQLGVGRCLSKPHWQPHLITQAMHQLLDEQVTAQCNALRARVTEASPLDDLCAAIEDLG